MQGIKDISSGDASLIISEGQKNYMYHWKLKKVLSAKYPNTHFGFNFPIELSTAFSRDEDYPYQWAFPAINAEAALNTVGQETKNIVVAVLDTGSPATNSAAWAASNFISGGVDFVNGDFDPTDPLASGFVSQNGRSIRSHGTHVGSTIAAKNDGNDINGFGVKVLPIKVIEDPLGWGASLLNVINGLKYASGASNSSGQVAPNSEGPVKVINMSLGFPGWWMGSCVPGLQNAINYAVAQGITVVAAAGNSGLKVPGGTNYPAGCDNVISVANLTKQNVRNTSSDYNSTVDISAPGTDIAAWDKYNRRALMSGTSMAAPIVSGVIANMYSLDSGITPAEINTYITGNNFSDDIGASGRDNSYGYGAINFSKAAQSVISGAGLSNTYAYASPSVINYGFDTTAINVALNKVGSGGLSVSNISAENPTGFSYSSSVDSNGFGTYTITLDRSSYPNGSFGNIIYFEMSNGTSPATGIIYSKGTQPSRANLGKLFVGLYNSSNNLVAYGYLTVNGSLAFETTTNVAIGKYYYAISTDIDNDGNICTPGEICEIYPLSDSSAEFIEVIDREVTGDAVLLRAISSSNSLASISEGGFYNKSVQNKEMQIPSSVKNTSINIVELNKTKEEPLFLIIGEKSFNKK